jgi:hypothetical protein
MSSDNKLVSDSHSCRGNDKRKRKKTIFNPTNTKKYEHV